MSKVTSKLQVTVPKGLAEKVGIRPGDEIDWLEENGSLRVVPRLKKRRQLTIEEKLAMFDAADERQRERDAANPWVCEPPADRGWTREELYGNRGSPR
jgi:AbrB family looped-hinge helix DNA binding protein